MAAEVKGTLAGSLLDKLQAIVEKHRELNDRMADPAVAANPETSRKYAREAAEIADVVAAFGRYEAVLRQIADADELAASPDAEMRALAEAERAELTRSEAELAALIQRLLVPRDPRDAANCFLEIRAGAGGDEAALFASDLLRAYIRFADSLGLRVEEVSESPSEAGGLKEVVVQLVGHGAYGHFKYEAGVHRVQRVPATEAQGRIHTSTCTVAVLPEVEESDIVLDPKDLRVDIFRSSGAGGQHVNKTSSAVRMTHIPTGIVVQCQDERSQHKNRAKAMAMLRARLSQNEEEKRHSERSEARRAMVGSGDRSEKIRTYNYPQNRVTDHRIGLTLHRLERIMEGDGFAEFTQALVAHDQAEYLKQL